MTLREAILESYNNACDSGDPVTMSDINSMSADEWALDLWLKSGVISDGSWTVQEITAEVIAMREEKVFG